MLLARPAAPLIDARPDTDATPSPSAHPALPSSRSPGAAAGRWAHALGRMAGLLAPRHAARKALSRLDAETAFAGITAYSGGDSDGRQDDVLSLRGRRILLARWGDPRREPYVLIPPQDAAGADTMAPWVRALRGAGYAVVAFARDPADQDSRASTWLDLAGDLMEVGRRCGDAAAVIGHSLGAMSVALALHQGLRAKRAILISAQADPAALLDRFAGRAAIGARAGAHMRGLLEARIGQTLDALQVHRIAPAIGIPVLVVHDLLDDDVPWDEGERFARHLSAARLLTTLDLGHHGVLADPGVLLDCVRFLAGATVGDKVVSSQNLPYGVA
jgi:pimeloyl-ACP methyl ester carboxylesterase